MPFEDLPTDVPAQYLTGASRFVVSGGDDTGGMEKQDFAWVMNEACGLARVPDDTDGRGNQKLVSVDEAGDDALPASEYTANTFAEEMVAWAGYIIENTDLSHDD